MTEHTFHTLFRTVVPKFVYCIIMLIFVHFQYGILADKFFDLVDLDLEFSNSLTLSKPNSGRGQYTLASPHSEFWGGTPPRPLPPRFMPMGDQAA